VPKGENEDMETIETVVDKAIIFVQKYGKNIKRGHIALFKYVII